MHTTRPSMPVFPKLAILCLALLLAISPVLPVTAGALRQEDVANYIAGIRTAAPDVEDLFGADNGTWDLGYTGETSTYFKAGQLHVSVDEVNTIAWAEGSTTVGDFYAEVDATHWEGPLNNQLGIIFRYVDADNFYFFAIGNDGYYSLQALEDNEWFMLVDWTETATIQVGEGKTNTLGVLVEGSDITLLINDYIVDQVADDTFAGGTLALTAGAFEEPPVDIAFDTFALWLLGEPPAPGPGDQLPVRVPERPRTPTPGPEEEITATPEPESVTPTAEPEEEVTPTPGPEPEVTPTVEPEEEVTPTPEPESEVTPTVEPEEDVTVTPEAELGVRGRIDAIRAADPSYSQDFAEMPDEWTPRVTDNIRYEVVDSALEIGVDVPAALGWALYGPTSDDFYVEVDGVFVTEVYAEFGILFRYVDAQNFYFLAMDPEAQFSIWRLRQNQWEAVHEWTYTDYIDPGADSVNRLGLLVEGERFTVLANDVVVAEAEDDVFPTGALALAVGTFDDGDVSVRFDDLALWSLEDSGESTVAPAAEIPPVIVTPEVEPGDDGGAAAAIESFTADLPYISDDFRRNQGYWGDEPGADTAYEYRGRAFHIAVADPNSLAWSNLLDDDGVALTAVDFYVEVDVTFAARAPLAAAGMLVRIVDEDNFYYAALSENGYYVLQKKAGGVWTDLITWSDDAEMNPDDGAVNRLGVLAAGSTLALTVNGALVGEVTDEDLADGGLALMAQTFGEPDVDVAFDNFDLWLPQE